MKDGDLVDCSPLFPGPITTDYKVRLIAYIDCWVEKVQSTERVNKQYIRMSNPAVEICVEDIQLVGRLLEYV